LQPDTSASRLLHSRCPSLSGTAVNCAKTAEPVEMPSGDAVWDVDWRGHEEPRVGFVKYRKSLLGRDHLFVSGGLTTGLVQYGFRRSAITAAIRPDTELLWPSLLVINNSHIAERVVSILSCRAELTTEAELLQQVCTAGSVICCSGR